MKKKILLIISIVIFILFLIFSVKLLNNTNYDNDNNLPVNKKQEIPKSAVLLVSDETFEKEVLNSEKPVLIDFYASWCTPCKKLSPIIEEFAKEHDEIKVVKINVDKEEITITKYNIYAMPTLIFIKNGKEVDRSLGLVDKTTIENMIKKNINE